MAAPVRFHRTRILTKARQRETKRSATLIWKTSSLEPSFSIQGFPYWLALYPRHADALFAGIANLLTICLQHESSVIYPQFKAFNCLKKIFNCHSSSMSLLKYSYVLSIYQNLKSFLIAMPAPSPFIIDKACNCQTIE